MTYFYNLYGLLAIQWTDPLFSVVPEFARKLHYFQCRSLPENCPFTLEICGHRPPDGLFDDLVNAAERFQIGKNGFCSQHQHGRMRWKSWVSGLESARIQLWYDFPWYQRLQWPWPCFPDYLIGFHLIEPLIEYILQKQNAVVLHAGAVKFNGKVFVLSGRGGVHKTTYIMNALQHGGEYFADDLVMMKEGIVYPYPLLDSYFDYFYLHEKNEFVTPKSMFGAFCHVRKNQPIAFPIASPQKADKVFLLIGSDDEKAVLTEDIPHCDSAFLDKIAAVDKLERLSLVDEEEATGRFMLQFNQAYGISLWDQFWRSHRELLHQNLYGLPAGIVCSGKAADLKIMQ